MLKFATRREQEDVWRSIIPESLYNELMSKEQTLANKQLTEYSSQVASVSQVSPSQKSLTDSVKS